VKVRHRPGPAIGKITGARLDVLGIFGLTTGPPLGEVLALRDRRLDLDRKQIKVSEAREETKAIGSVFKAPEAMAGRHTLTLQSASARGTPSRALRSRSKRTFSRMTTARRRKQSTRR
jgi:hypothetical protein